MHELICSILGLAGTSTILYIVGDTIITTLDDVVHFKNRTLTVHWAEAHTKVMLKCEALTVEAEVLTETVVETVGPFFGD